MAAAANTQRQVTALTTGLSWVGAALNNHLAEGGEAPPDLLALEKTVRELKATQAEIAKQAGKNAEWIERVTAAAEG